MAGIETYIKLVDGVTAPVNDMIDSMDKLTNRFEQVDEAIDNATNTHEQFGNSANKMTSTITSLTTAVKGLVGAYLSMKGVEAIFSFAKGSMELADVQNNVETQLQTVLMNQGATLDAYKQIKQKASEIQSMGMYGDEAMLGGAGEIATYISDPEAIMSMMDTLSNFASGMSGGGEVNADQMVSYATMLGKALDGSYDGLKKKGFELTEQQKEIIENGTDMEKALVLDDVISQSWDNLYETMSNTPQAKIIELLNAFGDLREEIGNRLYPVWSRIANTIMNNMDYINRVFGVLTVAVGLVGNAFNILLNIAFPVLSKILDVAQWATEQFYGAFHMAINGVEALFYGFLSVALTVIGFVAEQLSKLPFVDFDYEGISEKASEYAEKSRLANEGNGSWEKDYFTFDKWDSTLNWDGTKTASAVNSIAEDTTAMKGAMELTNEELKYLNDIAERDAINRFTTAEIRVDMTNNNSINSSMDLDGVISYMVDGVREALSITAEGVYA